MTQRRVTTGCSAHGHPEFVLEFDEPLGYACDHLRDYLEQAVADGTTFAPGELFQFGWSLLRIEATGDALILTEPDFDADTVRWVPGVRRALGHMVGQLETARSLDLEQALDPPTWRQSAIRCARWSEQPDTMVLHRSPPNHDNPADSGWFLGCTHDDCDHHDPDRLSLTSLYSAACLAPGAVQFLGLPVGTWALWIEDRVRVELDEALRPFSPDSYLGHMFAPLEIEEA